MRIRWPACLVGVGVAAFGSLSVWAAGPDPALGVQGAPVPQAAVAPAAGGSGYVGSPACERCHETEYGSWHKTLHVQMTKPIGQATVVGDFGAQGAPVHFAAYGRAYTMEARDGHYFISVSEGGRPAQKFEVNYTLGARRFQGYLTKLPDGRIYVLPAFWHNATKRWVDWKEITPIPDDPSHELRQIWNVTCVNCHATNLVKHYDIPTNTYATTWTEMGIGCEACHGPGRDHIALMDEWAKNPASKPAYDSSARNHGLSALLKIFSPRTATTRQVFDACGYCHGNKNNSFFGFKPGDRYEDYALPFLISEPLPQNDPQGDFWPDGRPSRFNRPQAITLTGCFQRGLATCTSCHRMHGAENDHSLKVPIGTSGAHTKQSDLLCTQCHAVGRSGSGGSAGPAPTGEAESLRSRPSDKDHGLASGGGVPASSKEEPATGYGADAVAPTTFAEISAHTHHAADSQGSRCINCHMSDVNWRLITRRLDHTFQPPVPEMTATYGVPNPCTTCHEDKSPEWAASVMDRWYGNGAKRRATVVMADAMYRAGTGDVTILPEVARYAVDRSHGALVRASAAEFVGQLMARSEQAAAAGPAVVNALIGAASDPEPMVRVMALRALGVTKDPRALPVLAAHLTDEVRLVRVAAATSLMSQGVTQLDGLPGQVLTRAQDEWAESLRTFNDVSQDQTALGWLESARGETAQAVTDLRNAIVIDARNPTPYVYLGVLAARAGKFEEALRQFKKAKALAPSYQNLDRLISEAQKRSTNRY